MEYNVDKELAFEMSRSNGHKIDGKEREIRGGNIYICKNKQCGASIIETFLGCTGSAIISKCDNWEFITRKKPEDPDTDYHSPHKEIGVKCTVSNGTRMGNN